MEPGFDNNDDIKKLMDGDSTAAWLQSHYEGTVYFLPLNPKKFPGLIWLTLEGRKAGSALEWPSRKTVYI